tara:strand:- start:154 stop:363 length:210 start_codon:yes stop_codon:yes gene_type:complete
MDKEDKMAKYKCEKCGDEKELLKVTIVLRDNEWVAKEGYCSNCELFMDSKPEKGIPNLIRTEETLTRKN